MDDKITIYPELGLRWYNDKYNNYYFGVSERESLRTGITGIKL